MTLKPVFSVLVVLALSFGGCADNTMMPRAPANDQPDLERTWTFAWASVPGFSSVERLYSYDLGQHIKSLPKGRKFPVVIYLHGCTGLSVAETELFAALREENIAVIAPDSYARTFRPSQCDGSAQQGGAALYVYPFRQEEILYALERIEKLPWVDRTRLYLVGSSEGGLATAHYRGIGFRARVIMQWTCHGGPLVEGISGPGDVPILAIVRGLDPWYTYSGSRQQGDCGAFMRDRPRSKSIVLPEGKMHEVLNAPGILQEVVSFLQTN